ncbi:hypothetical protein B0H15DRAFT_127405 [Mycena belliarum]|uniref:CASTOR ACT domain-containing protein n=1 Tax=Mycena belliarum TaxID=1033014 RepID=A0AAD6U9P7_9AGAR|nr:hypothetical protein B0H15DRAFT_127405 [Mycena belliae]
MQVTITRLPTAVNIISIPRPRLDALSHPVLRALLHPAPAFLSVTCNALELSLFAEPAALHAFDAIARADARATDGTEPVEISHDRWSVLQIDSHSDQLDNSGARVNELSAPLAAAGISILYQSSYMSDFIFVKERRLAEAMALFAAAGFALCAADPNLLTALLAPPPPPPPVPTRARSGSAPSASASSRSTSKSSSRSGKEKEKPPPVPTSGGLPPRDVRVLAPDLACVGLADDAADHWALKIVKLVAFPDLVPLPLPASARVPLSPAYHRRGGTSPVAEEGEEEGEDDGYFSHSPSPSVEPVDGKGEGENGVLAPDADVLPSRARPVPSRLDALDALPGPLAWLPQAGERPPDGSEEPAQTTPRRDAAQTTPRRDAAHVEHAIPFFSFTRTPEGSSLTAGARVLAALFPRAERHMVICGGELDAADREAEAHAQALGLADEGVDAGSGPASPVVPINYCSSPVPEEAGYELDFDDDDDDEEEEEEGDADADAHPLLSALQVDLRGAGLETHGLVHRFSRALAAGGVNHMYASTLRSANLLVPTGRARRAEGLLRGC